MFRMNGISRYESTDGLGRAKQDARAESTWMCGAIVSGLHNVSSVCGAIVSGLQSVSSVYGAIVSISKSVSLKSAARVNLAQHPNQLLCKSKLPHSSTLATQPGLIQVVASDSVNNSGPCKDSSAGNPLR